ncbi:MAG: amidoligase family protein [Alishewanella sp.]|nr:amidoligase family protein [Alishewanella sp.]
MSEHNTTHWLPPQQQNHQNVERQVGVELEFAGCQPESIVDCITASFGGKVIKHSIFNYQIKDSRVGDFRLELDAELLQKIVATEESAQQSSVIYQAAEQLLKSAAEQLVPWEVVTPPINISQLAELHALFLCLRENGAVGTRKAARYAFGLHLNPDLPDLQVTTIVRYLQAYMCLYDYIYAEENIDLVRKLTPYIDNFNKDYILKVVDPQYQPDLDNFIRDYMAYNPSRNRSLDLLPLIAHIDEKWVDTHPERALIKARPTLHYRLPNCDIDNPNWDLSKPWQRWLKVEQLADQPKRLAQFIDEFRADYQRLTRDLDKKWLTRSTELLQTLG